MNNIKLKCFEFNYFSDSAEYGIILEKPQVIPFIYNQLANMKEFSNVSIYETPSWPGRVISSEFLGKKIIIINALGSSVAACAVESLRILGVKYIIAIGTCGSTSKEINNGSVIIVRSAFGEDSVRKGYFGSYNIPLLTDIKLNDELSINLKKENINVLIGNVFTTSSRWRENSNELKFFHKHGNTLAIEMESTGLVSAAVYRNIPISILKIVSDCAVIEYSDGSDLQGRLTDAYDIYESVSIHNEIIGKLVLIALETVIKI